MNVAAKVRTEKEKHPERFCSEKNCLWRVVSRDGLNPCQKHPRTLAGQMISLLSSESRARLAASLGTIHGEAKPLPLTEQERGEVDAFRRNHGL